MLYERALVRVETSAGSVALDAVRADAHAHLAHAYRREGDLTAAETHVAAATGFYRSLDDRDGEARMLYEAAVISLFREHFDAARQSFERGLRLAREIDVRQLEAAFESGLGVLLQEIGELDAAIAHHTRAVQAFRDLGNRHREGSALYYLGGAYLERGEKGEAVSLLQQAADVIESVGAHRYSALIYSALGAAITMPAHAGDPASEAAEWLADAQRAFDAADRSAALCESEPALAATLAIHRLHISSLAADARVTSARALVDSATGDDPRFARRVLVRAMTSGTRRAANTWIFRSDGSSFCPPGGQVVDLSKRVPLRRIVQVLVLSRITSPGETLGFDQLLVTGWPDEQISHAAALNRLHVALTTLRKLGLRGILVSGTRGYLLDPSVPVERDPGGI